ILLPGFIVTARKVTFADLQGTGVRVPDEGLTVSGSLEEAWREVSPPSAGSTFVDPSGLGPGFGPTSFLDPTIIGVCHSRESGVEFDPEALISLGLCRVLNPLPMGTVLEDLLPGENEDGTGIAVGLDWRLTQVGRAVMEMCWVGGLALMSFGPS
ncbi:hypothetical protein BT96DRAFT_831374, partial [Gymnopus androsaceus JB14]